MKFYLGKVLLSCGVAFSYLKLSLSEEHHSLFLEFVDKKHCDYYKHEQVG